MKTLPFGELTTGLSCSTACPALICNHCSQAAVADISIHDRLTVHLKWESEHTYKNHQTDEKTNITRGRQQNPEMEDIMHKETELTREPWSHELVPGAACSDRRNTGGWGSKEETSNRRREKGSWRRWYLSCFLKQIEVSKEDRIQIIFQVKCINKEGETDDLTGNTKRSIKFKVERRIRFEF